MAAKDVINGNYGGNPPAMQLNDSHLPAEPGKKGLSH